MNPSTLAQQLKDVHLPPTPDFWPLAPMAYVVLIGAILILVVAGIWLRKKWRYSLAKRRALKEIALIKNQSTKEAKNIVILSILLRRVALAYFPREEVAGLSGDAWLRFLDKTGKTTQFSQGIGGILISAPYQKPEKREVNELITIIEKWINKRGKNV